VIKHRFLITKLFWNVQQYISFISSLTLENCAKKEIEIVKQVRIQSTNLFCIFSYIMKGNKKNLQYSVQIKEERKIKQRCV